MGDITDKRAVVMNLEAPTSVAYLNIYESGDIWVKVQGCEICPPESMVKCCNNCGVFLEGEGCKYHFVRNLATSNKPFSCTVKPYPDAAMPFCSLEFRCVEGTRKGQIRRVRDIEGTFH
jgi:hypothetical protein